MRRILVTGATGFVGASLVRRLIDMGVTELYITAREESNFWRISDITSNIRKIYYCDLKNRIEVNQIIEELRPDIIYHTATYGGFPNQLNAEQIIGSNLNATIHLLDAAILYGVDQFINTGSSSEYGIKANPMKETDLCEPLSLYGITKLAATNYCNMIGKLNNYKVCTLRLFSPYGELEDPSRLYPSIRNALMQNERPRLSRPNSVRDFIKIDQVMDVYMKITNKWFEPGDIINVGSGEQKTICEFYSMISTECGTNIEPLWGESSSRPNEPVRWEADIRKLKSLMND